MMTMIRAYLTWALCLLFVTGITLSSFGYVLCLGDNGHIGTESVCHNCCSDPEEVCFFKQIPTDHDHHECRTCTDRPLIQDTFLHRRVAPRTIARSIAFHTIAILNKQHVDRTAPMNTTQSVDTLLPSSASVLLSTIILRC